ncbi:uncharacterized protein LOC118435141 isoform X5 [Folsomia candida]|uniref:uncharacterized protein LOC118435141 isoform X5 n=1 Tax=Folsomia candida TaxID=158441 RepID=UPI001604DA8D|nr:uncharacterized protein LOC118435141 isoform X5 [Folsomia candida]XP_035706477.1 uncharacterized protein LOC118435141 isoform X5 [Folsomia candida]XP_035706478.1 uncharacterized protein LOC118435141 isoform X5 [Folsomia candida]XP_035706479.1 uncharacterized protein LOC118435141 isoform X5 [Folsomia candida]
MQFHSREDTTLENERWSSPHQRRVHSSGDQLNRWLILKLRKTGERQRTQPMLTKTMCLWQMSPIYPTTETGTTDIAEVQMSTSGSDVANPRKEQEKIVPTFHKGSDNSLPFVHGSATIPADRVSTKQIESNTLSASRTIKGDMGEHKNSITGLESTFGRSAMYKGSSQSMVKPSSTLDTKASQKIAADSTANAKSKTGNAIARAQNKIGGSAIATAQSNQGGFAKASAKIQGARNQSQDKEKVAVATAIAGKGGRTQAEAGSDDVNVVTDVSSSVEDPDSLKNIDDELGKNT